MSLKSLEYSRNKLSLAINIFLVIFLSYSVFYSEFFLSLKTKKILSKKLPEIFSIKNYDKITTISITNQFGSFLFQKKENNNFKYNSWNLTHPKELAANEELLKKIIDSIKNSSVKEVYAKDSINITNFSLDRSNLKINLNDIDNNNMQIKVGLINQTTNSTYISLKSDNNIYHMRSFPYYIKNLKLSDFINSKVFSIPYKKIKKIVVIKNNRKKIIIIKNLKSNEWTDSKNKILNKDNVKIFLNTLLASQSSLILDSITKEQDQLIKRFIKNPSFIVKLTDIENKEFEYKVSQIIYSSKAFRIKKAMFVLVKPSFIDAPVMTPRAILTILNTNTNKLNKLSIKKLFY